MDLREKKTMRALREAFFTLRAKMPLERITVKELSALAEVSKATFYLHYRDVYDISAQLQNDVIEKILAEIKAPELVITDPAAFTRELFAAFTRYQREVDILFSGSQSSVLPQRVESGLKEYIFRQLPEKREDPQCNIMLTFRIQGAFYAYRENRQRFGDETVIRTIEALQTAIPN